MTALKDYFTKYEELDRKVQTELSWLVKRAFPNLKLEGGLVSFDDEGDLLTSRELYELVRELMRLTGIAEKQTKSNRKDTANDLDKSKADDDFGPLSEADTLARLLATESQYTGSKD